MTRSEHDRHGEIGACKRLPNGGRRRFVDVHCHCLPNLDDGPGSLDEALSLCRALVEDNIGLVVATPHQLGRFEAHTRAERVLQMTRRLNRELSRCGIDLGVLPGAEIRLDERIGELLSAEEVLTLADMNRHVLLELPDDLFIDIEPLLAELKAHDVEIVIAHPERNVPLLRHLAALERWSDYGVSLEVTAGSLVGRFGLRVSQAAWRLVAQGWVTIVATDAHHCRGDRRPYMTDAFMAIENAFGDDLAALLCIVNPRRAARGQGLIRMVAWTGSEVE